MFTLTRDNGLDTVLKCRAEVRGDAFTGRYRQSSTVNVAGTWSVVFMGTTRTTLTPEQTGERVTGTLTTTDGVPGRVSSSTLMLARETGPGTIQHSEAIVEGDTFRGTCRNEGRLDGAVLTLSRDTGLDTIQKYTVTVRGNSFSGRYVNEGRIPDEGSFAGSRR